MLLHRIFKRRREFRRARSCSRFAAVRGSRSAAPGLAPPRPGRARRAPLSARPEPLRRPRMPGALKSSSRTRAAPPSQPHDNYSSRSRRFPGATPQAAAAAPPHPGGSCGAGSDRPARRGPAGRSAPRPPPRCDPGPPIPAGGGWSGRGLPPSRMLGSDAVTPRPGPTQGVRLRAAPGPGSGGSGCGCGVQRRLAAERARGSARRRAGA